MHRITPGTETQRRSFGMVPRPPGPLPPLPSSRPPPPRLPAMAGADEEITQPRRRPLPRPPPMPTFDEPSIAMRPFERWRAALVIGVTLLGAFAILGLHQLVRHVGATTGAVAQAVAEHPTLPPP